MVDWLLQTRKMGKGTALLVLICITCVPAEIYGFMPDSEARKYAAFLKRLPEPSGFMHSDITEYAILGIPQEMHAILGSESKGVLESFLGVEEETFLMRSVVDVITHANKMVDVRDLKFSDPEHHFDDESFTNSKNRLYNIVEEIGVLLNGKGAEKTKLITLHRSYSLSHHSSLSLARWNLGEALHTLQDFYSHTSWVDGIPSFSSPTMALKWPFKQDYEILAVSNSERNCNDIGYTRSILPLLTSGWYGENPYAPLPDGSHKCIHGGPGDGLTETGNREINKDTRSVDWSPNGLVNHDKAAKAAIEATENFIISIGDMLVEKDPAQGAEKFRLLLGVDGILLTNDGAYGEYSVTFNDVELPTNCNILTCRYCHPDFCNKVMRLGDGVSTILPHPDGEALREQTLYIRGEGMLAGNSQSFTISLPPGWVFVSVERNSNSVLLPIDIPPGSTQQSDYFVHASTFPFGGLIHKSNTYKIRKVI